MYFIIALLTLSLSVVTKAEHDYYQLLGVPRDATNREIRKAFKILALELHPDKKPDRPDAEEKFILIAKAYEVLKDPATRKQYDLFGDHEFRNRKQEYQSYSYYENHFGIYDDDPLITTLSKNDYETNVLDFNQIWFINFYSPHCYHCHEMAPTWRKLAYELEGVIRIAAVNCEEDYALCYQLNIDVYPTFLYYGKENSLFDSERYKGSKTLEAFTEYVLSKVTIDISTIGLNYWNQYKDQDWILILCDFEDSHCLTRNTVKKLAAALEGLLPVGIISDINLKRQVFESYQTHPIIFRQLDSSKKEPSIHYIQGIDAKEILEQILNILPNPPVLDEKDFNDLRTKLRSGVGKSWLFCFYLGTATDLKLELKRLPPIIPDINIGLIHCGKSAVLCSSLHIVRYPTWAIIKDGGAFEIHHGRDVLPEVAAFARDSSRSSNLHALSPADFLNIKNIRNGSLWFIDWFAPWCPPCNKLIPEFRKASQHFTSNVVQFGTVDCTLHRQVCSSEGIHSYPTLTLYNGSTVTSFVGAPHEADIVAFVQEVINPLVIPLDGNSFNKISQKSSKEQWIVNFYAPWCSACQMMEVQYRNFAKMMTDFKDIFVANVNCQVNSVLCNSQNIKVYPTIRLYPLGTKGSQTVAVYSGQRTALALKHWSISFLPSEVKVLNVDLFTSHILAKSYHVPWLVNFYAPWCGQCVHFEPEFMLVAQSLEGTVRSGKIDCEVNRIFCGHQRVTAYPTIRLYLSSKKYVDLIRRNTNDIATDVRNILEDNNRLHDEL